MVAEMSKLKNLVMKNVYQTLLANEKYEPT